MAKKMGRPKVADRLRRAELLVVRLRSSERRVILQAARKAGQPYTVWMRNALLRAARRAGTSAGK
jgi:uncharacterized protein (DUF1778 family)